MILDLDLEDANSQAYRRAYGFEDKVTVKIRPSMSHAITEVTKGIARMYPHKEQGAMIVGQSPFLYHFKESVARDGVKTLEFYGHESVEEITSVVGGDTLFFILSEDHAFSGEIYSVEKLISKLIDKKIFVILLRHGNHILDSNKFSENPYLIELRYHSVGTAVILGSRAKKIESLLYGKETLTYHFEPEEVKSEKDKVMAFESKIADLPGLSLYFDSHFNRLWDRTVFSVQKNAEPLFQLVQKKLTKGGAYSTSRCLYKNPFTFAWWQDTKFKDETVNTWLALDVVAIEEVSKDFPSVYQEFLRL